MKASLFMDVVRVIFASITYCVFELVEWVMHGIFDIAGLRTSDGLINDITTRIYVILGIFMAFKLIVSFLQYMVNPDTLADKEKGAGKLIVRTFTMLALLLMLPSLFPLLNRVQTEFLPVIPKVILGEVVDTSSAVEDNAKILSAAALGAFYHPSDALNGSDRPQAISDIDDFIDTYLDKVNGYYAYDFNILAFVIGVVMVILLLSITIKIGIRLFKMLILEMIAPIPIMSYIDPKSAKDGAFASWVKQLTSTFLDIFVRLGVIYVVLLILTAWAEDPLTLSGLFNPDSVPSNGVRLSYLRVFLIIALLMFAKDAPNFVKDAFGIKHDKDTSGALAAVTGGAMGLATGAVSGAISGRGFSGAVTGAMTGLNAGFQGGMSGKKANVWTAAGDAAIQARTGDSKAKSGILNAIQTSATKAQLSSSARKLNLTDDTLAAAKQNMIDMQGLAAEAERLWDYGLASGHFYDFDGNEITMEEADNLVARTSTASTIATKNYEKANKAGDAYGINRSFAQDYAKDMKDAKKAGASKAVYKAKGKFDPNKGKISR